LATQLYTALIDLKVYSVVADWPCPAGNVLPLDPCMQSTQQLLAAGSIELAPDGAVDNTTPQHVLRGQPGIKVGVQN
jgi:hypothetical protein